MPTHSRPSNGHNQINKDASITVKCCKVRENLKNYRKLDSLSEIDDAEISGYLNSKEEIIVKTILWEAINGNYKKAKKRKRTTETKKFASAEKFAKASEKVGLQKRSTRINYDALKLLGSDLAESSETALAITNDSDRVKYSSQGNTSHQMPRAEDSSYSEDQHCTNSFQDNDDFGCYSGEVGSQYDEPFYDEHFDLC
ncbi:uncharacterized protein LOC127265598 isoform X2 [Andrographis paniculata]|uniref:uncharacterized protein LOC127265598 isoform X2 n=1 Tax=Andrographis paniculata TaxID=175694 RepID=UPI0021E92483|nr:uncharacterized protein LOC127265598 isoform X2 [Andrographis paniculata]XP_051151435.1 uncharacterized protein LOC127265598 isoform X2 [Andrographis paniculata]